MAEKNKLSIFWFRQDLRLADNPGLTEAISKGIVLPIYIYDDINSNEYEMGSASKWWLHNSLEKLNDSLNNKLSVYKGDALKIIESLTKSYDVESISWNRCYEPWRIKRDKNIKSEIEKKGIEVNTFNGSLLWEPFNILKADGTPYRVFSPYYRKGCLNAAPPRIPLKSPEISSLFKDEYNELTIEDLSLIPKVHWFDEME